MAPGADPAFQQAMDKLLLQVDQDNVLDVHRTFQKHADDLRTCLQQTTGTFQFDRCGEDPVSYAVQGPASFGGKIAALFDVHWKHYEELEAVAVRLRETAMDYGLTEDDIQRSLAGEEGRP